MYLVLVITEKELYKEKRDEQIRMVVKNIHAMWNSHKYLNKIR